MAIPDDEKPLIRVKSEPLDEIPIPAAAVPPRPRAPRVPGWVRLVLKLVLLVGVWAVVSRNVKKNVDAMVEMQGPHWIASAFSDSPVGRHPRRRKVLFGKKAEQKFL